MVRVIEYFRLSLLLGIPELKPLYEEVSILRSARDLLNL
jgi:hypothetical protein